MLEQIKQWIEHRRGGKIGSHDPGNLPHAKTRENSSSRIAV